MQLIIVTLALALLLFTQDLRAQIRESLSAGQKNKVNGDSTQPEITHYEDQSWKQIDVSFLSSYYEQDGNNAAVTGGIGTEHLTDFTQKLIVTLPVSPKLQLNLDGGYDYYTSASSDNIDPIRSDDSREDIRTHGNAGFTYKLTNQNTIGARIGGSVEYDYASFQIGLNFSRESKDLNTLFNAQFQAFIDTWSLIYPIELRREGQLLPTNQRQSYNLSLGVSRVLDKKTQVSVQLEGVLMNGLLSTPFHRVYFVEQNRPKVEMLPSTRLKIPVGFRLNRYINEHLVARLYYRFYWDSWGMTAHTASVELPIKVTRFLAIAPSYRFHKQSGADYFKPYKEHSVQQQYYTSDFDLAPLTSHAVGLGVSYQPAGGIFNMKMPGRNERAIQLKSADLRYSHYLKNNGFQADIVSFGIGISFLGNSR